MSSSKKGRKLQSITGKDIPIGSGKVAEDRFAEVIADALQRDFGDTHAAIKIVAGLADANERAVKNWFMAENGPSGQHLIDLMRSSEEVLDAVLLMSGRHDLVIAKKLVDSKRVLIGMLKLIEDLESLDKTRRPDPRDVIYAAIHSAFVKYPTTVGGPSGPENWIPPSESAHLAGAVMMELEANGYTIERKD